MEISVNEGGNLTVAHDHNLRLVRPEGLERHRVEPRLDCSLSLVHGVPQATFNGFLQAFFLITLGLGLINITLFCTIDDRQPSLYSQTRMWGAALLTIFFAIGFVAVFEKKMTKNVGAAPQRKEGIRTISPIQHV